MMSTAAAKALEEDACAVCGCRTKKKCSGCKIVLYCSEACQRTHWRSEHKKECKDFQRNGQSIMGTRRGSSTTLPIIRGGSSKSSNQLKKILFPYEDFVELFNWDKPGFPPCGLINCGNSCFANAVLQCLAYTRPLIAFLLERGHRRECRRNDWCFLCEFQTHVERAQSLHPFSPINILSRLPNIGGNLGYGKQEDAHEFMRFAIDTMQSVCLDEFGGEKAVHPSAQETTLIQHIFGGHLQSQVICTKCNNVSNQFENMMDLTVEIQGDASSLEDCLDQFTAKEWLHGDNMYKCDRCNDYVLAWKRLTVRRAPNILTIALKRFQSGRFGKLNKKVTFPEILDLSPYMSETAEDNNIYKLYAVIVHVDMLNASFFGHYICYIKDFRGKWYRVDDCKVTRVDLDEVLSQGAYMLLYSRISVRRSCLYPVETPIKEQKNMEAEKFGELAETLVDSVKIPCDTSSQSEAGVSEVELSSPGDSEDAKEDVEMKDYKEKCPVSLDDKLCYVPLSVAMQEAAVPLVQTRDHAAITNRILQDFSSDQDSVASRNHVPLTEEMPVDVSAAVSSSSEILEETKPIDSREKSGACGVSDSSMSASNLCQDAPRALDSKQCAMKVKPMFRPGFLDEDSVAMQNHVDIKGELPLDVSAAASSSSEFLEETKSDDSSDKSGLLGIRFSEVIPASKNSENAREPDGSCSDIKVKPLFRPGFLKKNSVGTQNDVDVKEEMCFDISVASSSSSEVLETKSADSLDKTQAAPGILSSHGVELSNGFQDAAKKSDDKCFAVKLKPHFNAGFLEVKSVATQNHVDVKEEKHHDVSAADSCSNEVFEETKAVHSNYVTGKDANRMPSAGGVPPSNGFQDASGKSNRKRSAKPLFHRGFLEKHMQSGASVEAGEFDTY